jgi:hypothetical protein
LLYLPQKGDILRSIVAPIAGSLQRLQLGKLAFPVAKDVLRDAKLGCDLADRPKGFGPLGEGAGGHAF